MKFVEAAETKKYLRRIGETKWRGLSGFILIDLMKDDITADDWEISDRFIIPSDLGYVEATTACFEDYRTRKHKPIEEKYVIK